MAETVYCETDVNIVCCHDWLCPCRQMCKKYPGFLRVALQDPQPERRFFRRGWVTFDRTVNIREICWTLTNIRVSELNLCFQLPGN